MLRHRSSLRTTLKTRINKLVISAVVVFSAGLLSVQSALAGPGVWTTGGPRGGQINEIGFTPNGANIFVATLDGGLLRSTNGGSSWAFRNGTLGNTAQASAVAIQNSAPATMYHVRDGAIYKSTNGGSNWSLANSGISGQATDIAINQANPNILYVATAGNGIFKSTNGGTSWTNMSAGLPRNGSFYVQFTEVIVHPTTATTVYALGANGLYRTTNSGTRWTDLNNGILFQDGVNDLVINPAAPLNMLAATDSGVFKSTNGGSTWAESGALNGVGALALRPSTPNHVFAGQFFGGIQFSNNFGGSWAPANAGVPAGAVIFELAVNPATQTNAFAGLAYPFGVLKTTTAGGTNTWAPANSGINQIQITTVEPVPGSANTFLAATAGFPSPRVQKTTNSGASFANANTGLPSSYSPQDFDFFADASFGVVTGFGATAFTTNQGGSWTQYTGAGAPAGGLDVEVDKTNKNHVDIMTFTGIATTTSATSAAAAWTLKLPACFRLFTLPFDFAMHPTNGQISLLITNTGLYRTANDWNTCVRINDPDVPGFLAGVEFQPGSGNVIVFGSGAARSTDGGVTFTPVPALAGKFISNMFINPANPMNILAASEFQGILQSTDGGATFPPVTNNGLVSTSGFNGLLKVGTTIATGLTSNSVPVIVP